MSHNSFFNVLPHTRGKSLGAINFSAIAAQDFPPPLPNPLLDAHFCTQWENQQQAKQGVELLYGGYLEDRSALWRGHYHHPQHMRHLGLDIYARTGEPVAAPCTGTVVLSRADPDQNGGWGGQVHIQLNQPYLGAAYLIFGHLAHHNLPQVGQIVQENEIFSQLGSISENGGWSPHLHLQLYNDAIASEYEGRLDHIDGYGPTHLTQRPDMPNPLGLVLHTYP